MRTTLSLERFLFRRFMAECTMRDTSASGQIEKLMLKQLQDWGIELKKEEKKKP